MGVAVGGGGVVVWKRNDSRAVCSEAVHHTVPLHLHMQFIPQCSQSIIGQFSPPFNFFFFSCAFLYCLEC